MFDVPEFIKGLMILLGSFIAIMGTVGLLFNAMWDSSHSEWGVKLLVVVACLVVIAGFIV